MNYKLVFVMFIFLFLSACGEKTYKIEIPVGDQTIKYDVSEKDLKEFKDQAKEINESYKDLMESDEMKELMKNYTEMTKDSLKNASETIKKTNEMLDQINN